MPGVDAQGDAVLFAQMREDSLLVGGGGVLSECPHTAEGVATDEVVGVKFHDGGCDHIKEFLNAHILHRPLRGGFCSFQCMTSCFGHEKSAGHISASDASSLVLFLLFPTWLEIVPSPVSARPAPDKGQVDVPQVPQSFPQTGRGRPPRHRLPAF